MIFIIKAKNNIDILISHKNDIFKELCNKKD